MALVGYKELKELSDKFDAKATEFEGNDSDFTRDFLIMKYNLNEEEFAKYLIERAEILFRQVFIGAVSKYDMLTAVKLTAGTSILDGLSMGLMLHDNSMVS